MANERELDQIQTSLKEISGALVDVKVGLETARGERESDRKVLLSLEIKVGRQNGRISKLEIIRLVFSAKKKLVFMGLSALSTTIILAIGWALRIL